MRYLSTRIFASFFCLYAVAIAQTAAPPNGATLRPPSAAGEVSPLLPLHELPHADIYAVSFLPIAAGNQSMAFVVSPSGQLGAIPMKDVPVAYRTGYRPFTAADLMAIANSVADEEKDTERKLKELSEDYDALVARYNRLAAINSTPVVQSLPAAQPQPTVDERQAMRIMLFKSLLTRAFPGPAVRVQVQQQSVDCNKNPALCVNH